MGNRFDNVTMTDNYSSVNEYSRVDNASLNRSRRRPRGLKTSRKKQVSFTLQEKNVEKLDELKEQLGAVSRSELLDYIIENYKFRG